MRGDKDLPSTSETIKAYLPYLRRYARALTGSQENGDAAVRMCLETALKQGASLSIEGDVPASLYRYFHEVWDRLGTADRPGAVHDVSEGRRQLRRCLAELPPLERRALLLSSMEGFSPLQVALILGVSESEVDDFLNHAREQLWRQTAAEILVIEDDPIIALSNVEIVEDLGHKVVGVAARRAEAISLAARTAPTLVLADIKLDQGDDGIDTVREILRHIRVPVIFVTGHPERLLTGQDVEPAFVITKPFDPETLKTAINHALSLHGPRHLAALSA